MVQSARDFAAGPVGVAVGRALGPRGIAGENKPEDLLVLGPGQLALLDELA